MFNKIKNFFKEVVTEAKKVDWPSRETTLRYTALVLGISVSVAIILGLFDFVFLRVLQTFVF